MYNPMTTIGAQGQAATACGAVGGGADALPNPANKRTHTHTHTHPDPEQRIALEQARCEGELGTHD